MDGRDLTSDYAVWITNDPVTRHIKTISGPRVGIDYAEEWAQKKLRFAIKDNPFISSPKGTLV